MENENRLIDAAPLMKSGWHLIKTGKSNEFLGSMSLADVPTVDAVEVVRCKDCKHYIYYGYLETPQDKVYGCKYGFFNYKRRNKHSDVFCSYGERKDNEQTRSSYKRITAL